MKIIYISQHFPPEIVAAQGRAFDLAKYLVKDGNDVTVLTTFPNYESHWGIYKKEIIENIDVRRSFRITDTKTSSTRRLSNYLSFMVSSIFSGLLTRKADIIYATSPQLFVGVSGFLLSRLLRAKFVLEVRDLWVDFAEILSQFNNKLLLKWARKLELFLYRKADKIITVTYGYKEHLIKQGIDPSKIEVVTNGVDPKKVSKLARNDEVRAEHNIADHQLLVLFAGNIGSAQGLDVVIDAAKDLHDHGQAVFMFIGEGVEKEKLKKEATRLNLTNIIFLDGMKRNELLKYYAASDVCLVSLKKHPLFEITIPSKVFDCMSLGKPMLIGVDGEARRIIEDNNAGIFFEPEYHHSLVKKINMLFEQRELLDEMTKDIEKAVLKKYNRQKQAKKLTVLFNQLLKK